MLEDLTFENARMYIQDNPAGKLSRTAYQKAIEGRDQDAVNAIAWARFEVWQECVARDPLGGYFFWRVLWRTFRVLAVVYVMKRYFTEDEMAGHAE